LVVNATFQRINIA